MKKILFRKLMDIEKGTKAFSITQKNEDKDCITHVRKSFVYQLCECEKVNPEIKPPEIHMRKSLNTKKGLEKCHLEVKGAFFVTSKRLLMKVNFQHSLDIQILWKTKIFSPKKSEVLT